MLNFGEGSLRTLLGTRTPDTSCLPCYPCPANITSLLIYQGLFGERGWLMAVPVLLMAFSSFPLMLPQW